LLAARHESPAASCHAGVEEAKDSDTRTPIPEHHRRSCRSSPRGEDGRPLCTFCLRHQPACDGEQPLLPFGGDPRLMRASDPAALAALGPHYDTERAAASTGSSSARPSSARARATAAACERRAACAASAERCARRAASGVCGNLICIDDLKAVGSLKSLSDETYANIQFFACRRADPSARGGSAAVSAAAAAAAAAGSRSQICSLRSRSTRCRPCRPDAFRRCALAPAAPRGQGRRQRRGGGAMRALGVGESRRPNRTFLAAAARPCRVCRHPTSTVRTGERARCAR
jgi:hypothetical protein